MHAVYVQGCLCPVQAGRGRVTPALKSANIHLHWSVQKQRLHPSLRQYPWLEAGLGLLTCDMGMRLEVKLPAAGLRKGPCVLPYPVLLDRLSPCTRNSLDPAGSAAHAVPSLRGTLAPTRLFVTSFGHPDCTTSNAQWGSQSPIRDRHGKCQAWASSHSCPLTAVEPQTKISTVWMSDNVLQLWLYSVIFVGGKRAGEGNTCPLPGIINVFLYEMRKACMSNP